MEQQATRPMSVQMYPDDFTELERIARVRRSTVSQVAREYIAAGIERQRRIEAAEAEESVA